jgi:hypothetical protein
VSDRSKYSSALPPMNIEIRYGNNEPDLLSQSLTSLAGHSPLARLASTAAGKSHRESHGRPDATTLPEAASQQRFRPPLAPGALVDRPRVAAAGQIKPRATTPTTRCNDVARSHVASIASARFTPRRASSTGRECGSGADQTPRTAAPATRCNDVAPIGQFRPFAGSMNFGTTPPQLPRASWASANRRLS